MALAPPSPVAASLPGAAATVAPNRTPPARPLADAGFAATLQGEAARAGLGPAAPEPAPAVLPSGTAQVMQRSSRTQSPLEKFEGFVLRSFVEAMLPSENSSFFGTGTAGEVWKSMLAEQIGDELARSGGIGIADLLAAKATQPGDGEAGANTAGLARSSESEMRQIGTLDAGIDAAGLKST